MPVKNFITGGTLPNLVRYEPYNLTTGLEEPSGLNEMISIDLRQQTTRPTIINYSIGAENDYRFNITCKNLTNNTSIEVRIVIPLQYFRAVLSQQASPTSNVINMVLNPLESRRVEISLNKNFLDSKSEESFQADIEVSAKNLSNGSVITRDINVSKLQEVYLPEVIAIN